MGNRQFSDNATSILAATITNVSTVVQVSIGEGSLFPALSGTEFFIVAVEDTSGNVEYMKCTSISGDNLTVVRGQEGTTAIGFTADLARVELRNTAGTMADMYQKDGDTLTGPMDGGGHNVTNIILGSGVSIESATEIVNTPIRGSTGVTANEIVVPADGTRATVGGHTILATGDLLPVFTIGMVMMWNAAILDIPAGWHVCDGTGGTPDLRDKFILGAGNLFTLGQTGSNSITTSSDSAGTPVISPVTLLAANLAAHQHPFDYFFGAAANPITDPGGPSPAAFFEGLSGGGVRNSYAGSSAGSGTPFTPTATALAGHSHTVAVGPFYALFYIMFTG